MIDVKNCKMFTSMEFLDGGGLHTEKSTDASLNALNGTIAQRPYEVNRQR